MDTSKFDDIWQLMSEYTFEMDPDTINENLLCIICNRLMIDACQSTCGCQYCYECVSEYLREGDKYCPGGKEKCHEEYLRLDRDVLRNVRMNKKIYRLRVLCPNESCQSKIELPQMREHLRVCGKQAMECPYSIIGCDNGTDVKDNILAHLGNDALVHTHLLIECVNNLRNEVRGLKDNFNNQIEIIKEESRMKEGEIRELNEQIRVQKRETELAKEECLNKENRIVRLEVNLVEVINRMEVRFKEEEDRRGGSDFEGIDVQTELCELRKEINDMKVTSDNFKDNKERRLTNLIRLCPNIDVDFVWRIGEFKHKMERMVLKSVYSESFYTNNYRLCLCLWIDGDNIGLWCYIMRGDHDDSLEWPMNRPVTLSVINQDTLRTHKTETYKYDTYYKTNKTAFHKPINDKNDFGFGVSSFIKYSSIKEPQSVIVNDSIVVTCSMVDL